MTYENVQLRFPTVLFDMLESKNGLAGSFNIPERAQRLVVVDVCRRDGRQHGRLGVAAQVLFEQPREHRVPVRNELGLLLLVGGAGQPRLV